MGQFENAGFAERDLGIVVTGLPMLFHSGAGEHEVLARRLMSARLIFELHEGGDPDARFLRQELHFGVATGRLGQLLEQFGDGEPEFLRFLVLLSVMFNRVALWISSNRE